MAAPLSTNPQLLPGPWSEGYALDVHSTTSHFAGYNEFGHPEYRIHRTPLGEALYDLKYQGNESRLGEIVETVHEFLKSKKWISHLDQIVAMPPSNPRRKSQPVMQIARELGVRAGVAVCGNCIQKVKSTPQLKDVHDPPERRRTLAGAFQANAQLTAGKRLLLIDDLYRSGATAESAASALLGGGKAAAVYFIAVTRTRKDG